jgi:hypothetical protein
MSKKKQLLTKDDIKKLIPELFDVGTTLHYSDMLDAIDDEVDLELLVEACDELEAEGKLKPHKLIGRNFMKKIVINNCYGGFGLSEKAIEMMDLKDNEYEYIDDDIARDDPRLIDVVEKLGGKANGLYADLTVIEIPDDVEWQIEEYDGMECVAEKHRVWP